MERKGQVTVFIILGIVLMGIFATVLFITNSSQKDDLLTNAAPIRENVPQEFVAIQQYVESCMYSVGKKGVKIMGQQGGYIYPESLGDFSITHPTESLGIDLGAIKVPYWHYNKNQNQNPQVDIDSLKPALSSQDDSYWSMESQLARYLDENLDECLSDFTVFESQGFLITQEYPESQVVIRQNDILLQSEIPIDAQKGSSKTTMDNFVQTITINLPAFYDAASEITLSEQEYTFLENHLINVMSLYAMPGGQFPPFLATTVDQVNTDVWFASQLELDLKDLLSTYVPVLRHQGSSNYYRFDAGSNTNIDSELIPLYAQTYDNMVLPLQFEEASTLSINFNYFGWEPYFDINGGEQTIRPQNVEFESQVPLLNLDFAFQNYLNTYDISYPVLVTIEDQNALDGEGFTFNIALEANIINNEPFDENYIQPETSVSNFKSVVCDDVHKGDTLVKTLVLDAYTGEPISDVYFEYVVPNQDTCDIGVTGADGVVQEQYPSVVGGELELQHEDYLDTSFLLDTAFFSGDSALIGYAVATSPDPALELYKQKELDATVSFRPVTKCVSYIDLNSCLKKTMGNFEQCMLEPVGEICADNVLNIFGQVQTTPLMEVDATGSAAAKHEYKLTSGKKSASDFTGDVQTTVILERVSDIFGESPILFEDEYTAVFAISSENPGSTITLYPGIYSLTAIATINFEEPYVIPKDLRCPSNKEDLCEYMKKVSLDSQILGQLEWTDESSYITILPEDLYSSNSLEILMPAFDWEHVKSSQKVTIDGEQVMIPLRVVEDTQIVTGLSELSKQSTIKSSLGLRLS